MKYRSPLLILPLVSIALAACAGDIGRPADRDDDSRPNALDDWKSGEDGVPASAEEMCDDVAEPFAPLPAASRRLSWAEIDNALADLFPGVSLVEFADLAGPERVPDRLPSSLASNESFLRDLHERLEPFTQRAAASVVARACKDGAPACLEAALVSTARRAWRGQVGDEERRLLSARLAQFLALGDPIEGYAYALRLVLGSPRFTFLLEPGSLQGDETQAGVFRAQGERLAGMLAAALWGSVPDDELLQAASDGDLDDSAGLGDQVDRMLADPRARRGLASFFRSWLQYNLVTKAVKDEATYPSFDNELRRELLQDTEETLLTLVFDDRAPPSDLLTSPLGHVGERTIAALRWEDIAPGRGSFEAVGRSGIATHPSLLAITSGASETSIVNRGRFFVEKLLCEQVPDPPPDVMADLEKVEAEADRPLSSKEVVERHSSDPACASCHRLLDPFGIVFEGFDAIGGRQSERNGVPIDTSVHIDDTFGISGDFDGPAALMAAAARTRRVDACFASGLAAFVSSVDLDAAQRCRATRLLRRTKGATADPTMLDIVARLVQSESFLQRRSNED